MLEREREIHIPTDEEEAEIQREIALDPDAPGVDGGGLCQSSTGHRGSPGACRMVPPYPRGKQKAPTKVHLNIPA